MFKGLFPLDASPACTEARLRQRSGGRRAKGEEAVTEIENERAILLQILKGIEDAESISDVGLRRRAWEQCWRDHASPPYFGEVVRRDRKFYHAPGFEQKFLDKLVLQLALDHFGDVKVIAEFGCGSGRNLRIISSLGQR